MRRLLLAACSGVLAGALGITTASSTQHPALAGTWDLDGFVGPAPVGYPGERGICPMPPGHQPADEPPSVGGPSITEELEQVTSLGTFDAVLTISQSDAEVTVQRKYWSSSGEVSYRDVFKLDGTESAATNGKVAGRTASRWQGNSLIVEHDLRWTIPVSGGCRVQETFSLESPSTLSIVATRQDGGQVRTSWQTYLKRK